MFFMCRKVLQSSHLQDVKRSSQAGSDDYISSATAYGSTANFPKWLGLPIQKHSATTRLIWTKKLSSKTKRCWWRFIMTPYHRTRKTDNFVDTPWRRFWRACRHFALVGIGLGTTVRITYSWPKISFDTREFLKDPLISKCYLFTL